MPEIVMRGDGRRTGSRGLAVGGHAGVAVALDHHAVLFRPKTRRGRETIGIVFEIVGRRRRRS